MSTCSLVDENGAAYALGALERHEARQLDEHLALCRTCRETLASDLSAAAALAFAPPLVRPPAHLRARILAAARGEAADRRSWWSRLLPRPVGLAAAAAFATLAFAVSLSWGITLQSRLDSLSRPTPAALASAPSGVDEYGAWSAARAQMRRLAGSPVAPEARGWIYLDLSTDEALLVAYRMPPLEPTKSYQLWLIADGQRSSGGVFNVDEEGYGWLKVRSPRPLASYQRVGITVEPRVGSDGPTGQRVLGGDL